MLQPNSRALSDRTTFTATSLFFNHRDNVFKHSESITFVSQEIGPSTPTKVNNNSVKILETIMI